MDGNDDQPPAYWIEALARADEDIAAGRTVPASIVFERLRAAIVRMEAQAEYERAGTASKP